MIRELWRTFVIYRGKLTQSSLGKAVEYTLMTSTLLFQVLTLLNGGKHGYGFLHLFVFPVLISLLFGHRKGRNCNVCTLLFVMSVLWIPHYRMEFMYSKSLRITISLALTLENLLIEVMMYQGQYIRARQEELKEMQYKINRQRAEFLANMSHEFKTPMNAIVGLCELMEKDVADNAELRDKLARVKYSSNSMLEMIDDVLDYSDVAIRETQPINSTFDVSRTIEDVVNIIRTKERKKNIDFFVSVDPNVPKGLAGDEKRIRQIMVNLITNGLKFTQFGGVALNVGVSHHDYGVNLQIMVEDTGIGIEKKNTRKIFEGFAQIDSGGTRREEGRGLGLALCKKLTDSMNGFIYVKSRFKEGSRFHVAIPMEVKNGLPIAHVDAKTAGFTLCYIDLTQYESVRVQARYRRILEAFGEQLQIQYRYCDNFDIFKTMLNVQKVDRCFVSYYDYMKNPQFYRNLTAKMEVIVVREWQDVGELPKEIHDVQAPFSVLTVANVINREPMTNTAEVEVRNENMFIAPEISVLVVDDNPMNLLVAAGFIKPYKVKVLTAESGEAALKLLRNHSVQLIFMDYMMPEMDGIETLKRIRLIEELEDIPVIAFSADAMAGSREMFLRAGFDDYLEKPVTTIGMYRMLRNWIAEEKQIPAAESLLFSNGGMLPNGVTAESVTEQSILDMAQGLFYTGTEEVYLGVLESFVKSSEKAIGTLQQFYETEDWKNYMILAHGVKSTAKSIGAMLLSERAKTLELASKAHNTDTIRNNHEKMLVLFREVADEGKQLLNSRNLWEEETGQENSLQPIEYEEFVQILTAIEEACEMYDVDLALEALKDLENREMNHKSLQQYYANIRNELDEYEYHKVTELVKQMKEETEAERDE